MTEQQHLDQCRRNYGVFNALARTYVEWAATVLFYTALHFVEAWLCAHTDWQGGDHRRRESRLASLHSVTPEVYDAYVTLREVSQVARYGVWTGVITAPRLAELHHVHYRTLCEHFDAPPQVFPPQDTSSLPDVTTQ